MKSNGRFASLREVLLPAVIYTSRTIADDVCAAKCIIKMIGIKCRICKIQFECLIAARGGGMFSR